MEGHEQENTKCGSVEGSKGPMGQIQEITNMNTWDIPEEFSDDLTTKHTTMNIAASGTSINIWEHAPDICEKYAADLRKHGTPLDSALPDWLDKLAAHLREKSGPIVTLTADKELPASTAAALGEMCRLAARQMMTGSQLIAEERERQISREGWTPEHDDQHQLGELCSAAGCYMFAGDCLANATVMNKKYQCTPESLKAEIFENAKLISWPFEDAALKIDADPIRSLAKAGALIAAEIDRLKRKSENATLSHEGGGKEKL